MRHTSPGRFRPVNRIDALLMPWLATHSARLLRMSLGFVFLAFGVLKFFPGVSPAEEIAERTMSALTLGIVPEDAGRLIVAAMESAIGLCLLTGRWMRIGITLLGLAMIGVMSPLVLFPGDLFAGDFRAPTLVGQYVLKDLVLLAAANIVVLRERGAAIVLVPDDRDLARQGS
jgi:putative oxidoreductase